MDRTTVSYDVALHLLSTDGHVLPLTAILQYDARDPLAVTALFNDGSGEPIRWVVRQGPAGSGPGPVGR